MGMTRTHVQIHCLSASSDASLQTDKWQWGMWFCYVHMALHHSPLFCDLCEAKDMSWEFKPESKDCTMMEFSTPLCHSRVCVLVLRLGPAPWSFLLPASGALAVSAIDSLHRHSCSLFARGKEKPGMSLNRTKHFLLLRPISLGSPKP